MKLNGLSVLEAVLTPGALTVLFQPVVEQHGSLFRLASVESLVRGPRGSTVESAGVLFDYVRRKRAELQMDRACVTAVCRAAERLPAGLELSINVHAATLANDEGFLPFLVETAREHDLAPGRITVEIVEHAPQWAGGALPRVLVALREAGLKVALDDIGLGQSNYRMILDCRPDSFKIDAYFVRDAHRDYYRQAVLESVAGLAAKFGAVVVAEGVETWPDLEAAGAAGIRRFQGYFFAHPLPAADLFQFVPGRGPRPASAPRAAAAEV